jgi:rSAM/selenodomain-associated transferase 2
MIPPIVIAEPDRATSVSSMELSVIIPALNEGVRIRRAIESARNAGAAEVVVVDGGSEDDTVAASESAGAIVLRGARGRAAQQNRGAQAARGRWLLFLHADNWLAPEAGAQLRGVFRRPDVGCGAFRQRIDAPGILYRGLERGNALRIRLWSLPYGDQGIFVRRDLFEQLGGFPPLPLMEDVALMRKLSRLSRPVLLPGPLHVDARRWQRQGVVQQTLRNWSLLTAYYLGVSPTRLAPSYPSHDESPRAGGQ